MVNAGLSAIRASYGGIYVRMRDFPTLEMRVSDICTHIDDAVAVAALYVCLARRLIRLEQRISAGELTR